MFKVAVGHSNDPDSLEAVKDVIAQCQKTLDQDRPQAGLLFAALDFDHELILAELNQAFPGIELIGGTTDGEISSVLAFQQDSLTLMLFSSDSMEIRAAVARNIAQDPLTIACQAAQTATAALATAPSLCIAIPESLTTSVSLIVQGLQSGLGSVPLLGGATADQLHAKRTYQFFKTEVLSDAVPFLLFAGNLLFSYSTASGWHPIGKRSLITRSEGNVIYEIDGKPALEFYRYYLNQIEPDAAYPLAVFPPGEENFFLRGVREHDAITGSITVFGDVPEQAVVQITDASLDNIITASKASLKEALQRYPGEQPEAALFFSCAWRRIMMGTRTCEEYEAVVQSLQAQISSCGFYTYGEISPLTEKGLAFFHNTTFVTLLLGSQ